jgi:hypothetical protein
VTRRGSGKEVIVESSISFGFAYSELKSVLLEGCLMRSGPMRYN